ncbi:MAG TPA: VOC family protein [Solirubrobacteraceae bacterium]|nr:VOC family protein [Solirubrobacteraceae bacterium]
MSERDGFQPGVPCWVATVQFEPERAADFYGELFGWETTNLMAPDEPGDYIICELRGRPVAAVVSQHGAPPPPQPAWGTYIQVESADETARKVAAAAGSVIGQPFDSPGGGRQAVLADPSGAVFCAWEPREHKGAQLVNEPSAWSMSSLATPDPEDAKRFYGEVFGWESEDFGGMTVWRLPGFVGGVPQQPVPRDVVAVLLPPNDAPPHWSVDFWVHDVDESVAKAEELGGSVVVRPFEPVPGFKSAVLADPHGAAFGVSKTPG